MLLGCATIGVASGQFSLEAAYRSTGDEFLKVFEAQRQVLQQSSALIQDDREQVCYGVVIAADGWVLTKASEFAHVKSPKVIVGSTSHEDVRLGAVDLQWDVALIKLAATNLQPVVWASSSEVPIGSWVVANGVSSKLKRRALAGVISAKIHPVGAAGGVAMGVAFKPDTKALVIDEVHADGGARLAGLQKGDVIFELNGTQVQSLKDLASVLEPLGVGTRVDVKIRRAGKVLDVPVVLSARAELYRESLDRNDEMSGDFSRRRSGFPRVLQHSILGNSTVVGGPLLDLDGRCLGMNIARANRAETFAIPVEDLRQIAERLMQEASNGSASPALEAH